MRAMVPSSFMISQITPAGKSPARRAMSTAASVWPARTSTPPSRATSGKTWPGLTISRQSFSGLMADRYGLRAVVSGNAGRDAFPGLDGDGERGGVPRLVGPRHGLKMQRLCPLGRDGEADQAAAEPGHEVDSVRRGHLRGDNEVAFVLAILGVHENEHAALPRVLEDFLGGR